MPSAGSDDRATEDDKFVAEYEHATAADVIDDAESSPDTESESDDDGAVAGSFAPDVSLTPQRPAPENVLFVSLGVYLTVLALAQTLPGVGVVPQTVVVVTVAVALVTGACYGLLVVTTPDT